MQFINIYRFNLYNYNVEVLLLGAIVLSKRCIAALGCGVWAEVAVRFPAVATSCGGKRTRSLRLLVMHMTFSDRMLATSASPATAAAKETMGVSSQAICLCL